MVANSAALRSILINKLTNGFIAVYTTKTLNKGRRVFSKISGTKEVN
jgi:hypothetical protein